MGRALVHHDGLFLEWSTVVDAPVTYGMTEDEMRDYIKTRYGEEGLAVADDRIARAREHGTSFVAPRYSFDELIVANRAGLNETELTKAELIEQYFTNPPKEPTP